MLGFVLFLMHMLGFKPHDYFFNANPNIEKYSGVNVVSMTADLSFFTYHSLIFLCLWLVLFSVSELFHFTKLNSFTRKNEVLSFITANYIFTVVLYTLFELTGEEITFGLYANTPKAIYNFVTNIVIHYFYFLLSLTIFIKTDTKKVSYSLRKRLSSVIIPSLYLWIYFFSVKITGLTAYKIIWYPYPIFDAEMLAELLMLTGIPFPVKLILNAIVLVILWAAYLSLYQLLMKLKARPKSIKV